MIKKILLVACTAISLLGINSSFASRHMAGTAISFNPKIMCLYASEVYSIGAEILINTDNSKTPQVCTSSNKAAIWA